MRPVRFRFLLLAALFSSYDPFLVTSTRSAAADDRPAPAAKVKVAFVVDIMLDRDPGNEMLAGVDPFAHVARELDGADVTIGNLECVVATSGVRLDKSYTFRADPKAISLLAPHFDAVSLANNHTGDFGHAALIETMFRLRRSNIASFGASGLAMMEIWLAPCVAERLQRHLRLCKCRIGQRKSHDLPQYSGSVRLRARRRHRARVSVQHCAATLHPRSRRRREG